MDNINHPPHYEYLKEVCGVEVIDITRHMDFNLGNAVKYIMRAGRKSEEGMADIDKEIEDIKKAIFYLNDYVDHILVPKKEKLEGSEEKLSKSTFIPVERNEEGERVVRAKDMNLDI